ncbi:MAG: hypothetical protein LBG19_13285 [Prevotellaceae bacterium]|jgi:hypothetical protein|nr:hypothetical protein [Prevotellaceae bacterium]
MRAPVSNAEQLAGQLPGVRFDRISDEVKIDNQSSILLLVNNIQRSKAYVSGLSPDRIESIEVIKNPAGRFVSDDYYAVINYILKKDDAGYQVGFDNFTILDPSGANGNDWLVNEQPKVSLNFFNQKIDAYANYTGAWIKWNYPISLKQDYVGAYNLKSDDVSEKEPNQNFSYYGNVVGAGFQYQIAVGHSLFARGDYAHEKTNENTTYNMLRQFSGSGSTDRFIDQRQNQDKFNKYTSSLNYVGQLSSKLLLKQI